MKNGTNGSPRLPSVLVARSAMIVDDALDDDLALRLVRANDSCAPIHAKNANESDHDEPRRHDRVGMHGPEHRQVPEDVFAEVFLHEGVLVLLSVECVQRANCKHREREEETGEVPGHRPPGAKHGERHRDYTEDRRYAGNYLRRSHLRSRFFKSNSPLRIGQQGVEHPAQSTGCKRESREGKPANH